MKKSFLIEDDIHAEQIGEYDSFEKAYHEIKYLALKYEVFWLHR